MSTNMLYDQIQEAVAFLRKQTSFEPAVGFILGTGLSGLADDIDEVFSIAYGDIPHFPVSTVESHKGRLIFGHLAGVPVEYGTTWFVGDRVTLTVIPEGMS